MKKIAVILCGVSTVAVSGCAGLTFNSGEREGALTYRDPEPYLFVSRSKDCLVTATVISLPAEKRSVTFNSGYGSAELSVELSNGMITKVGQKTDTKIPETITAVTGLAKAAVGIAALDKTAPTPTCKQASVLFPIIDGRPMAHSPISLPF